MSTTASPRVGNSAATPVPTAQGFWTFPQKLLAYLVFTSAISHFLRRGAGPEQLVNEHPGVVSTIPNDGLNDVQMESPSQFQQTFLNIDPNAKLPVFPTVNAEGRRLGAHRNLFKTDDVMDMHLYITHDFYFDLDRDAKHVVWVLKDVPYNWSYVDSPHLTWNLTITPSLLASFNVNKPRFESHSDSSEVLVDRSVSTEAGVERIDRYSTSREVAAPNAEALEAAVRTEDQKSIYAHVFLVKTGNTIDLTSPEYDPNSVAYERFNLLRHRKRKVEKKTYKLLEKRNDTDADAEAKEKAGEARTDEAEAELIPHFCPTLDIAVVMDIPPFKRNDIPSVMLPLMHFNELGAYFPVIYHNDFFLSSKNLIELNESFRGEVVLDISYSHLSFMRWHMQSQMEQQWKSQSAFGTSSERDTDMIREVLFDTNPILLVVTFAVSLLHSLFDFLAFKNDIQFWRKKKNMAGMSVQSLGVNCFFQTVIFLYLMDNDTSWMILISSGVGLLIEYWKLGKAFNVTFSRQNRSTSEASESSSRNSIERSKTETVDVIDQPSSGQQSHAQQEINDSAESSGEFSQSSFLGVTITYKLSDGYSQSKTKEYDAIATTHLLYGILPVVFGYSCYSLVHISHKSFYSWFLGSLVGFVYSFGFVLMTPQLFINYKLQSVAHMPWKAMVYKSLNTFIDDLFAFVIKMPIMHRLACFRDDIIFFIYLYQKWAYRVDHTRTNEFGQGGDEGDDIVKRGEDGENTIKSD